METLTLTGPKYKTRPLSEIQANKFRRSLEKRPVLQASDIQLFEDERKKERNDPIRWRVFWKPSAAAIERIKKNQIRARKNRAQETFREYSISTAEFPPNYAGIKKKNEPVTYVLNLTEKTCTCPDYQYACAFAGIQCKHWFIYRLLIIERMDK